MLPLKSKATIITTNLYKLITTFTYLDLYDHNNIVVYATSGIKLKTAFQNANYNFSTAYTQYFLQQRQPKLAMRKSNTFP